jgi:hypothetical protein
MFVISQHLGQMGPGGVEHKTLESHSESCDFEPWPDNHILKLPLGPKIELWECEEYNGPNIVVWNPHGAASSPC